MTEFRGIERSLEQLPGVRGVGGFFSEFWKFAAKGNILDLAIGVVIGTSFTAIVNSLVADIIMPLISLISPSANLATWQYTLHSPSVINGLSTTPVVFNYGHLVQVSANFVLVALSIFVFFKLFSQLRQRLMRTEEAEQKAAPPDPVSTQEKLLCEIRDLLRERIRDKKNPTDL